MDERLPPDADKALVAEWCARHAVRDVLVGGADTNGTFRAKRLSVDRFLAVLEAGLPVTGEIFALDSVGEFVSISRAGSAAFPFANLGYPDARAVPDPSTLRRAPWDDHTAVALAAFTMDGVQVPCDPRGVLRRAIEDLRLLGYEPLTGYEFEFYLLAETEGSLRGKGFTRIEPFAPHGRTLQVTTQLELDAAAIADIRQALVGTGNEIWADHVEEGPGQCEITLEHGPTMDATDAVLLQRVAIREIARRRGLLATFMAKPHAEWQGSSGHLHVSLTGRDGPAFIGSAANLSAPMRWFIGGTLDTLPDCSAFQAPTVNSYKRLQPGSWAGTTRTWGFDNRSVTVRVVLQDTKGSHLELRRPGSDANPYLAAATALAAGAHGIRHEMEPPAPALGNVYDSADAGLDLPQTLDEAVVALEKSTFARDAMGEAYIAFYLDLRRHEIAAHRRAVTDWEVGRYISSV